MFYACQWNCFNLVYTCNIALILFLNCDVNKFRIPPPPLSYNVTLRRPHPPLNVWRNLWMAPNKMNFFRRTARCTNMNKKKNTTIYLRPNVVLLFDYLVNYRHNETYVICMNEWMNLAKYPRKGKASCF